MKNMINKYIGLDVHKKTIAVAIADANGDKVRFYGMIENTPEQLEKLVKKLKEKKNNLSFCYEAGPCGYYIYRQIKQVQQCQCCVVAPSLIPKKAGDRVKTDRRDSEALARLLRAGELTPVWVPDSEQEAMRDLTRAREDAKAIEKQTKLHLHAFLLRHGFHYTGKSNWTQAHFRWMEKIKFEEPCQQSVFQDYVDAVKHQANRVQGLEKEMQNALKDWSLAPVVQSLMALRGCQLITAMTLLAELGDLTRFDSPKQLMAYLGLVPSEYSSGGKRKQGGITKTGNGHVRRLLIESAWCYRFQARKTRCIEKRAERTPEAIQEIAWKAQKRLCGRYKHLKGRGKRSQVVVTAVARELAGFIWSIACEHKKMESLAA